MLLFLWMVVQVCLESLPISSSGHTSLLLFYFPEFHEMISIDQLQYFDWALHSITLVVMTIFFWDKWWQLILHKNFHIKLLANIDFWKKFLPAFLFVSTVSFIFFTLYIVQSFLPISIIQIPLSLGFFITAFELCILNYLLSYQKSHILVSWNLWHAILLGVVNSLLVHIPGVSRCGTNFLLCQFLGYKSADAFAISWMIFFPFALAGGLYGILKVASDHFLFQELLHIPMLLVMVGAGIISYLLLWCFSYLMNHKKIYYLAWYMIVPIALSLSVTLGK